MSRHSNDPSTSLREARAAGYTAARIAQGVPVLDRDLNLLGELAAQSVREVLCRYLGDGLVSDPGAFEVRATRHRTGVELGGPGWAVVAGMEVSLDATRALDTFIAVNPDSELPVETDTTALWYWLEVWLVEVDEKQDPALANPEDVGLLTSTRWRPTWTIRKTNSSAAPSLEAGHRALALACVRRTGTNIQVEDLRPVGLTLGQSGAAIGRLTLRNAKQEPRVRLDAAAGAVSLSEGSADLKLSASGVEVEAGGFSVTSASSAGRVELQATGGDRLVVREGAGLKPRARLAQDAILHLGGGGGAGALYLYDSDGTIWGRLGPSTRSEYFAIGALQSGEARLSFNMGGRLKVGAKDSPGELFLQDHKGHSAISLTTDNGDTYRKDRPPSRLSVVGIGADGKEGNLFKLLADASLTLGGPENTGQLTVAGTSSSTYSEVTDEAVVSTSAKGSTRLRGDRFELRDQAGKVSVQISSADWPVDFLGKRKPGEVRTLGSVPPADAVDSPCVEILSVQGGQAYSGHVEVASQAASDEPKLTATLTGAGLTLRSSSFKAAMLKLDTETGVGTFAGTVKFPESADCAERFPLADEQVAPPGTVLVTSTDEALRPCERPYDTRVVGVVSGAGGLKPGIVLNAALAEGAVVALVGRVYCKVDASFGAIAVGDLLTTSSTPGHAMRAADRERAFGAVLGKALGALAEGQGLIPILVTLQ